MPTIYAAEDIHVHVLQMYTEKGHKQEIQNFMEIRRNGYGENWTQVGIQTTTLSTVCLSSAGRQVVESLVAFIL